MKEQHSGVSWPVFQAQAPNPCTHGHDWQPTIIIGYFQCRRCGTFAACHLCVSRIRGAPLVGVCQQHRHVSPSETEQEEVLV